ncbi:MAG: CobW family GTP-binding protein [Rhodopila sp.]
MPPLSRSLFVTHDTNRAKLPVALLSGFLGSGKTTLVNALLRHPAMAGTAVAVNEFGEIPLDAELIDHGADQTVVLANGCLCCNLSGEMDDAVMRLFSRREHGEVPSFQRLIIEPSGLSDPAPIAQAILRNPVMAAVLRLETIVTTVDALFAAQQLARHPETRKQIALADRLVVTKPDLADTAALAAILREINPIAPILTAIRSAVAPEALLPPSFLDLDAPSAPARSLLFADAADPAHASRIASVSLTADAPLRWRPLEAWLRRLRLGHADALLRLKGLLRIDGADGPVVVQGVHHVMDAPVMLDAWPSDDRRSRLVLIADEATIAAARQLWQDALPQLIAA